LSVVMIVWLIEGDCIILYCCIIGWVNNPSYGSDSKFSRILTVVG
jgi:hypothetical protein